MTRIVLLAAALAVPLPASAQSIEEVRFEPGNYGAMVSGEITGHEFKDFLLGANAGQEMFAELTVTQSDGSGTVYFNILPPGSDGVAIYNGSIDGNTARITLPEDGTYAIRAYQRGDDEDSGKTSAFRIDLSIQ